MRTETYALSRVRTKHANICEVRDILDHPAASISLVSMQLIYRVCLKGLYEL